MRKEMSKLPGYGDQSCSYSAPREREALCT